MELGKSELSIATHTKPLNRWYTAAPWRLEAGQRHRATSSAVSTFQLASRSTNSAGLINFYLRTRPRSSYYLIVLINLHILSLSFRSLNPTNPFLHQENLMQTPDESSWKQPYLFLNMSDYFPLIRDSPRTHLARDSRPSDFHEHFGITERGQATFKMGIPLSQTSRSSRDRVANETSFPGCWWFACVASRVAATRELSPLRAFATTVDAKSAGAIGRRWLPARTDTTWSSRIALLAGSPAIVRFATRPRAGASADVGRHPRDYIDPRGAPFSAPLRRVLLCKPTRCDAHTTTPGHCTLAATCPINHPVYAFFAYTDTTVARDRVL